jgi:hypothetical protein
MSGIGRPFPDFALTGVVSNDVNNAFQPFTHESFPGTDELCPCNWQKGEQTLKAA